MADEEPYTFDSLSKMMVFDLREICKNEDLSSSGNKSELIVENWSVIFFECRRREVLFLEETKSEEKTTSSKNIEKVKILGHPKR